MTTSSIPLTSSHTRHVLALIAGAAPMVAIPVIADYRTQEPDAHGRSPHRIDRAEARDWLSGPNGPFTYLMLGVGVAVAGLYTSYRKTLSERERNALINTYFVLGGMLGGTLAAPMMLRPLKKAEPVVNAPALATKPA